MLKNQWDLILRARKAQFKQVILIQSFGSTAIDLSCTRLLLLNNCILTSIWGEVPVFCLALLSSSSPSDLSSGFFATKLGMFLEHAGNSPLHRFSTCQFQRPLRYAPTFPTFASPACNRGILRIF